MTDTENPVALAGADRARNANLAGWRNDPEHTSPPIDIQRLRAAWLMRRVPLSPQSARAVLSLYFGETMQ
jgi:hypothetical protein